MILYNYIQYYLYSTSNTKEHFYQQGFKKLAIEHSTTCVLIYLFFLIYISKFARITLLGLSVESFSYVKSYNEIMFSTFRNVIS